MTVGVNPRVDGLLHNETLELEVILTLIVNHGDISVPTNRCPP